MVDTKALKMLNLQIKKCFNFGLLLAQQRSHDRQVTAPHRNLRRINVNGRTKYKILRLHLHCTAPHSRLNNVAVRCFRIAIPSALVETGSREHRHSSSFENYDVERN